MLLLSEAGNEIPGRLDGDVRPTPPAETQVPAEGDFKTLFEAIREADLGQSFLPIGKLNPFHGAPCAFAVVINAANSAVYQEGLFPWDGDPPPWLLSIKTDKLNLISSHDFISPRKAQTTTLTWPPDKAQDSAFINTVRRE
jgi:hypothetical protein